MATWIFKGAWKSDDLQVETSRIVIGCGRNEDFGLWMCANTLFCVPWRFDV